MKPLRPRKAKTKSEYYNEISLLVQQYLCVAMELKGPLNEFFSLAQKAKSNPLLLPEKHPAESILQELVEIDHLLRGKIRHAHLVIDYEVIKSVRTFLPVFNVRDITPKELGEFLNTALENSKKVMELINRVNSKK